MERWQRAQGTAQEEKSLLGNVQFGGPAEKQSTLGRHVHKILAVRGNYLLPIFRTTQFRLPSEVRSVAKTAAADKKMISKDQISLGYKAAK